MNYKKYTSTKHHDRTDRPKLWRKTGNREVFHSERMKRQLQTHQSRISPDANIITVRSLAFLPEKTVFFKG